MAILEAHNVPKGMINLQISEEAFSAFSRTCLEEERAFFEKWSRYDFKSAACAPGFAGRWEKKNKLLRK